MKLHPTKNAFFDDETTKIMGAAYERACKSMPNFSGAERMRLIFAKRILEGARLGERDPHRLHLRALNGSTISEMVTRNVGVVRDVNVPAYAQVPRTACEAGCLPRSRARDPKIRGLHRGPAPGFKESGRACRHMARAGPGRQTA